MKLTENFTLEEMIKTNHNIYNNPTGTTLEHIKETANMLQSIRDSYDSPILITSGYRCPMLNNAVGGSKTSAHIRGYAADTKPVDKDMKTYQKAVLEWAKTHDFDQIIIEFPTNYVAKWIHIGLKSAIGTQRKQLLYTLNGKNYAKITDKHYLK